MIEGKNGLSFYEHRRQLQQFSIQPLVNVLDGLLMIWKPEFGRTYV